MPFSSSCYMALVDPKSGSLHSVCVSRILAHNADLSTEYKTQSTASPQMGRRRGRRPICGRAVDCVPRIRDTDAAGIHKRRPLHDNKCLDWVERNRGAPAGHHYISIKWPRRACICTQSYENSERD